MVSVAKLTCSVDNKDNCGDEFTTTSLTLKVLCDERESLEAEGFLEPSCAAKNLLALGADGSPPPPITAPDVAAFFALLIGYFDITCPIRTPEV